MIRSVPCRALLVATFLGAAVLACGSNDAAAPSVTNEDVTAAKTRDLFADPGPLRLVLPASSLAVVDTWELYAAPQGFTVKGRQQGVDGAEGKVKVIYAVRGSFQSGGFVASDAGLVQAPDVDATPSDVRDAFVADMTAAGFAPFGAGDGITGQSLHTLDDPASAGDDCSTVAKVIASAAGAVALGSLVAAGGSCAVIGPGCVVSFMIAVPAAVAASGVGAVALDIGCVDDSGGSRWDTSAGPSDNGP